MKQEQGQEGEDKNRSMRSFPLYYNKDDSRPIVPKNHGYGSTINFANRRQVVQFFFVLLAVIVPILLAIVLIVLSHH